MFALLLTALTSGPVAGADVVTLGRLFLTPAERANLDHLRQQGEAANLKTELNDPVKLEAGKEPVVQLTIDGVVKRSSGKNTAWINQEARTENEIAQTLRVRQQKSKSPEVSVLSPAGKRVVLKAGQTYDINKGVITDIYQTPPTPQND
ncbi:hypothetical protein [Undibacterium sp. RuTC16W]|uniref:hypothetical protein n=1 Tax=Undibacterium sp. RuTC16W TaxID=3413048 RepID=UPI003BF43E59